MDMTDTRYYPLTSVDSKETMLVPMFAVTDPKVISGNQSMYLSEIIPEYFRLHSYNPMTQKSTDKLQIRCPRCGKTMKQISANTDTYNLSLYRCNGCKQEKEDSR
ncbi:MAG: hypothetical protein K5770_06980 [Lachnospiraceae bacterium]|nr:hypothetical protein [Lachnospiraceae bacterium]